MKEFSEAYRSIPGMFDPEFELVSRNCDGILKTFDDRVLMFQKPRKGDHLDPPPKKK